MEYTIGQVSEKTGLPVSTLRYYDNQGLFPHMERSAGIRKFTNRELETIRMIECLKKTGMEIRNIRQFMQWCAQGSATYAQRKALLEQQQAEAEAELARMRQVLDMLTYKCWYYDQAIQDGNEDRVKNLTPESMPEEIRRAYQNGHAEEPKK